MKKLLVVFVLAVTGAFFAAPQALAQTAQFTFTPTSLPSAAPGATIQFDINLVVSGLTGGGDPNGGDGAQNINGITYFLQQMGGSTFPFSIVGRNTAASPFNDGQFADSAFAPGTPDAVAADGNPRDLGRLSINPMLDGTYFVATISLAIAGNAAPGDYTIQTMSTTGKAAVFNDDAGDTAPIQPASLVVTVVPEPSTYALLAFAGLAGAIVVLRRRATVS